MENSAVKFVLAVSVLGTKSDEIRNIGVAIVFVSVVLTFTGVVNSMKGKFIVSLK